MKDLIKIRLSTLAVQIACLAVIAFNFGRGIGSGDFHWITAVCLVIMLVCLAVSFKEAWDDFIFFYDVTDRLTDSCTRRIPGDEAENKR